MAVTINGTINIENLVGLQEVIRPKLTQIQLGYHGLALNQHMKGTLNQYQVNCVWSGGNTDFTNKKAKLQNIVDAGLPVWLDAQDWSTNTMLFGRLSDLTIVQSEGRVDIWDVSFLITSVFPWGYIYIVDDGTGDFRIYDTDKVIQSRILNPLIRLTGYTFSNTFANIPITLTYSIYVKNIGSNGTVKLELQVPDGLGVGSISESAGWTEAAGNLGDAAISNTPGSKSRITLSKAITSGTEELLTIVITIASLKTSFIDGSVDDIAA